VRLIDLSRQFKLKHVLELDTLFRKRYHDSDQVTTFGPNTIDSWLSPATDLFDDVLLVSANTRINTPGGGGGGGGGGGDHDGNRGGGEGLQQVTKDGKPICMDLLQLEQGPARRPQDQGRHQVHARARLPQVPRRPPDG
jgi:hypothetical protein